MPVYAAHHHICTNLRLQHGILGDQLLVAPVKIVDLAERIIRLSGLEPGRDIQITFTGIRPGERLHEILFAREEERFRATLRSGTALLDTEVHALLTTQS